MSRYIVALDQGTTSTRALLVDEHGRIAGSRSRPLTQSFPRPGWVEHDAAEIADAARDVIVRVVREHGVGPAEIAAIGITNQRETVVAWDRLTGEPVAPALVWQDTRATAIADRIAGSDPDRMRALTGLPLAGYFSAPKLTWLLENTEGLRERVVAGDVLFGTVDSWLLWTLTGGPRSGVHATDPTNASRTLLLDLHRLEWSDELLAAFDIPGRALPRVGDSSGALGVVQSIEELRGIPIAAVLGDQQAAAFGQAAVHPGDAKCTYGTGNFVLVNTGRQIVQSQHNLIATAAYRLAGQPASYALEGSVAVTGSLVQWLRDGLGMISEASEVEELALQVPDTGDVYIVPAFSGLLAPRWRPDARGVLVGLTRFTDRRHIARAALEAVAFQTAEVVAAVRADLGSDSVTELKVDGGMSANDLLMQLQSDILGSPVVRPVDVETTALGAAYAAGLAVGFWHDLEEVGRLWREGRRWEPGIGPDARADRTTRWEDAVSRSLGWV